MSNVKGRVSVRAHTTHTTTYTHLEMRATQDDMLYADIRRLQRKRKCSDQLCQEFADVFEKYTTKSFNSSLYKFDVKLRKASGVGSIRLHGCPDCDRHVYGQKNKASSCPKCGNPRFDTKGNPREVRLSTHPLPPPSRTTAGHIHTYHGHTHSPPSPLT